MTYWEFTGRELVNCTCEYGCNCQFNALPDKGHCHAVAGIQIDEGKHGDTRARRAQGRAQSSNGRARSTKAMAKRSLSSTSAPTSAQRDALLKIMTGQDTDPFATMFAVYASTVTKMHEPVFTDIDFEVDVDGRRGRLSVAGYVEMTGEPIRNKVSGEESRAQIVLPAGFEYDVADIGSASSRTTGGPCSSSSTAQYGQFANLHLRSHGVVRG